MQKKILLIALFVLSLSYNAHANLIFNGDFGTCDLSGFSVVTDTGVSNRNDATVNVNCQAQIGIDGAGNSSMFVSSLWHTIAIGSDSSETLEFSFDYSVMTDNSTAIPDLFTIGFFDPVTFNLFNENGNPGYFHFDILSTDIPQTTVRKTIQPDILYDGVLLIIQLTAGFDNSFTTDGVESILTIDNLSLTKVQQDVPTVNSPQTALLLFLSMIYFIFIRKSSHGYQL